VFHETDQDRGVSVRRLQPRAALTGPIPRVALGHHADLLSGAANPDPPPEPSSPAEFARDVALLRIAIQDLHPGYGRYTSREITDLQLDALEARSEEGMSDLEFYLEVSRILGDLRCDHTLAEVPDAFEQWRSTAKTYLPFRSKIFGRQVFVDATGVEELARGDEILAINGVPVGRVLFDVEPLIAVDGYTDTVKPPLMEFGTEFMGGAIDHFFGFLYGWTDTFDLVVRRGDDERTTTVAAVDYPIWQQIASPGQKRYSQNFDTSVSSEVIGDTGVLRIGTFVNYRNDADVVEVLDPHFTAFREAGVARVVLDLRACGGGSSGVPFTLLKYLVAEPFGPAERWDGELIVLCGPANASGATNFLARLGENRDVTFVGRPTGGSLEGPTAGLIFFVTLPHSGVTVRLPWFRQFNAVTVTVPGRAIAPDVWIEETYEDWIDGLDPVMEWVRASN